MSNLAALERMIRPFKPDHGLLGGGAASFHWHMTVRRRAGPHAGCSIREDEFPKPQLSHEAFEGDC